MTEKKEPRPEPGLENQLRGRVSISDCSITQPEWETFLQGFADWSSFWTLTFRERDSNHHVGRTEAEFTFRRLIQILNTDLFGHNYTRIVGHSYFSYAAAFEHGKQGHLHMHVLADRRVNYALIHRLWRRMAGIVDVRSVTDKTGATRYLAKYVSKGGQIMVYRPTKIKEPAFKPGWYTAELE